MTTSYTFECSNTISKPEAELAFSLGLQLINAYRDIHISENANNTLEALLNDERNALTKEKDAIERVNQEIKKFYEDRLTKMESKYEHRCSTLETRLQQAHDQHSRALDALKCQESNYVQEKLGEIAGMLKQSNKSLVHIGNAGESSLHDYGSQVFRDFAQFTIEKKSHIGHMGDYHLHFKDFSVIADSKNYTSNVTNTDRVKIKYDLEHNPHIEFAWLVSLYSGIDKYDKYPIMVEWANTKQCIIYINQLHSNPEWLLRSAWYLCDLLHKMNADHDGQSGENVVLKERLHKAFENVKSARTVVREINTNINTLKDLMRSLDDRLKMVLETETQAIVESGQAQMEAWWSQNVCKTDDKGQSLVSSKMWTKYKQDTKAKTEDKDAFMGFIKGKVDASMIKFHGKGASSAFDMAGLQWNETRGLVANSNQMQLKLNM